MTKNSVFKILLLHSLRPPRNDIRSTKRLGWKTDCHVSYIFNLRYTKARREKTPDEMNGVSPLIVTLNSPIITLLNPKLLWINCTDTELSGKMDYSRIPFSLISFLTLDVYSLTFVWLRLLYHTPDLYVLVRDVVFEGPCFRIASTTEHLCRSLPALMLSYRTPRGDSPTQITTSIAPSGIW